MPLAAERSLEEPLEHEIDPELQKQLLRHPGRWVAMTRSELLAVGDSPADVLREARERGVMSPILYHVPRDHRVAYFF